MEVQVTAKDYLEFAGVDLNAELSTITNNNVGDTQIQQFIDGIADWLILQAKKPPYNFIDFATEHQKRCFKNAVLSQIQYVLRNGNIANESGLNETLILPKSELDRIKLSSDAYDYMRLGGMLNLW